MLNKLREVFKIITDKINQYKNKEKSIEDVNDDEIKVSVEVIKANDDTKFTCKICDKIINKPVIPYNIEYGLFNKIIDDDTDGSDICIECFTKRCKSHYIDVINITPENNVYKLIYTNYNFYLKIYGSPRKISTILENIKREKTSTVVDVLELMEKVGLVFDIINEKSITYKYTFKFK